MHLLRRRHARDHGAAGSGRAEESDPRSDRGLYRGRRRSEALDHLQPEPGVGTCRTRLGLQLHRPPRLAEPHDAVQGESRQGPRERLRRALFLSHADGGRHPGLPRHRRARRRGPEAASRTDPRHRAEVQQRLRRLDRGAGPRRRLLPAARADDAGAGAPRHEPARRHQEDVEVGPVRPLAHQPDGRCRDDRRQDPQGQDRSGAPPLRGRGPERSPRGREPGDDLCGSRPTRRPSPCSPNSAAASSRASNRRWRTSRSADSRRSRPRCAACSTTSPTWTACWPMARPAPRHRAPQHGGRQGYCRLRRRSA